MPPDVLEMVLFEEESRNGLTVWACRRDARAHHRVEFTHEGLVRAEKLVKEIEGLILKGVPAPDIDEVGSGLFKALFRGDDADTLFKRLPNDEPVSLAVVSPDRRVLNLPWEFLRLPKKPTGPNPRRPVVRIVPTVEPCPGGSVRRAADPVRVLFVASEPADVTDVDRTEQEKKLREEFDSFGGGRVQLTVLPTHRPTRKMIRKALDKEVYDVVHFVGHGADGKLILADDEGQKAEISAEEFAALLDGHGIRMVVLAACRGAGGAFDQHFGVVATSLVRNGVPAVVAMQYSIDARVATMFVSSLYTRLLAGLGLDAAVAAARKDLADDLGSKKLDWGIPVLYRRYEAVNPFFVPEKAGP